MQDFDLAQKIKILKAAELSLPYIRAAAEPYNPEKPTMFDSEVTRDVVKVNQVINSLLGVIQFLVREILLSNKVLPRDTWRKLNDIKKLITEQKNTITGR